jgi:hypothetical protein
MPPSRKPDKPKKLILEFPKVDFWVFLIWNVRLRVPAMRHCNRKSRCVAQY